ncbi:hypothetical protein [Shewanella sp. TB4-MNA-CIBAN-0142]|uniref:hypothetical protein n=1 Tax=Shewanella sp. TB4-MNA-CIBAN-0142 TaxID=3140464 RepID=UPI0033224F34
MFLIIFIFLFIFMPNLYGHNILYFLSFFSYIYLFFNIKIVSRHFVIDWYFVLLLVIFYAYFSISKYLSVGDFSGGYVFFLTTVLVYPISVSIIIYTKCYRNRLVLYKYILYASVLQSVIFVFSLMNPEIHNLIINSSGSERLIHLSSYAGVPLRSFGLARSYTFTMPIFMAFAASMMLFLYMRTKSYKFIILMPMFLLVSFFNARVGIIVFGLFLFLILVKLANVKLIIKCIFFCIMISIFSYIFMRNGNGDVNVYQLTRLMDGVSEIGELLDGNKVGTFSALFGDMFILPKTLYEFILGTGINIYERDDFNSDVGYVLDIYEFGFVGLIMKFFIYGYLLLKIIKNTNSNRFRECFYGEKQMIQLIVFGFFCLLPILHIKGNILSVNEIMIVIFLLRTALTVSDVRLGKEICI